MTDNEYWGASADAIRHHYDVGNEFYELWLDPSRTYSCAMYDDGAATLEAAQARKHDYLIEQANAAGAGRVLDVGCGWGALLRRLVEQHSVAAVVGLTLSDAQGQAVREAGDDRVDVRVESWSEHVPAEPYDSIISIGAFEHFARYNMRRADRIAAYRSFFTACHDWLVPGGRLALQTITKGNNHVLSRQTVRDMQFIIDRIFPESQLPAVAEIFEASQGIFDVVTLRNDPDDYARTCASWRASLLEHADAARRMAGADVVADYDRYLAASSAGFTNRHMGLARIAFERR